MWSKIFCSSRWNIELSKYGNLNQCIRVPRLGTLHGGVEELWRCSSMRIELWRNLIVRTIIGIVVSVEFGRYDLALVSKSLRVRFVLKTVWSRICFHVDVNKWVWLDCGNVSHRIWGFPYHLHQKFIIGVLEVNCGLHIFFMLGLWSPNDYV